jgi:hypothetical protein
VQVNAHESSSKPRRNGTLELRVGAVAAARINKALTGTPYEWMLDLSAKEWPADAAGAVAGAAANPCLNLQDCMPNADGDIVVEVSA